MKIKHTIILIILYILTIQQCKNSITIKKQKLQTSVKTELAHPQKKTPLPATNEEKFLMDELLEGLTTKIKKHKIYYSKKKNKNNFCGFNITIRNMDSSQNISNSSLHSSRMIINEFTKLLCNVKNNDINNFPKLVNKKNGLWLSASHHQSYSVIEVDLNSKQSELYINLFRNVKNINSTSLWDLSLKEKTKSENSFFIDVEYKNSWEVKLTLVSKKNKALLFSPSYIFTQKKWWLDSL